ncbi:hypothetical protein ES703_18350 [subsurface metagenome]
MKKKIKSRGLLVLMKEVATSSTQHNKIRKISSIMLMVIMIATVFAVAVPGNASAQTDSDGDEVPLSDTAYIFISDSVNVFATDQLGPVKTLPLSSLPSGYCGLLDTTQDTVYVAHGATPAAVTAIDAATFTKIAEIPVSGRPNSLVVSQRMAKAYVFSDVPASNRDVVDIIDISTNTLIKTIVVGPFHALRLSADEKKLFLLCFATGGEVVGVINTEIDALEPSIMFPARVNDVATSRDGTLLFANRNHNFSRRFW